MTVVQPVEIETPRLRLRELEETDAPALFALYNDAAVMRFMGPPPTSLDEERANIVAHREEYYRARGYGLWGVMLRESDAIIGRCGLLDATIGGRPEVELSYLLAATTGARAWRPRQLATSSDSRRNRSGSAEW